VRPKGVICISFPRRFFGAVTPDRAVSWSTADRIALRILAVILFLVGKSTLSLAAPCTAGTLQDYIDLELGGCTVGNLRFYNFDYEPSADDATEIPADGVTVNTDAIENLGVGLMFAANWSVTGSRELDGTITYDVEVLNNERLTVESTIINGAMVTGDGTVYSSEDTNNANLEVYLNSGATEELDSASFPGVTSDSVTTYVEVAAGSFSSASVQSVSNLFVVPEPSTWAMMLLGFGGLGYVGWRQRAKLGTNSRL
jgi:PEP-CTERM motif